jgi:photosystem II stability/assembly factor-like uncharacterized protein
MVKSCPSKLWLLLALLAAACGSRQLALPTWTFVVEPLNSGSTASLRGLSVVNENVVWASGSGGVVLRSLDAGATWQLRRVPDADSLDFRDVEAFDSLTAFILSAGEDGRIYRTTDGGATWQLQFRNEVSGAFFDCIAFFSPTSGLAMSDPVEGRFLLLQYTDTIWRPLPQASRPPADSAEAAFAASGTCLTTAGDRAYLATGGGQSARVFWSDDSGDTWHPVKTPVPAGAPSAGIFSLAFRDRENGIAIGGDYQKPDQDALLALTTDGGESWRVVGKTAYVSGAAWSKSGASLLAVGTRGTRLSRDRGLTWTALDTLEYNAVQLAGETVAYAVGPRGRIAKLKRL